MTAAFYTRDAGRFVASGIGVSPWSAKAQLGVALAGLIAEVVEAVPAPTAMVTARLTIDIMGAVPFEPLTAVTRIAREGPRLQLIDAELRSGDRIWVRATAMRVRTATSPDSSVPPAYGFPPAATPATLAAWIETIRVSGSFEAPGPGAAWVRITAPVIAGEAVSPLARAAMTADIGSGIGSLLSMRDWTFANVDIALHLTRPPQGEWLLIDACGESAGNGIGLTTSMMGDRAGMIGTCHQTMFIEPRPAASPGRNDGAQLDIRASRMPGLEDARIS